MLFKEIIGQESIKQYLTQTVSNGRIPHAQLFVAPTGSGALPMAVAYAQYILCGNSNAENNTGDQACNLKFEKLAHPDLHFAFPVAIMRRDVVLKIHELREKEKNKLTLEPSFSKAFIDLNLYDSFNLYIYANKDILNNLNFNTKTIMRRT